MNSAKFWWGRHPIMLGVGVLVFVCTLMIAQKFFRYGGSPGYELSRSLLYNLLVMVPFAPCAAIGVLARKASAGWLWRYRALLLVALGVGSIILYAAFISGVLYAIGWSSGWMSPAFLTKYTSGPMHVHAAFFVLMQFLHSSLQRSAAVVPETIEPNAKPEDETVAAVFGIPLQEIVAFESDDHYVWVRSLSNSVLKRTSIRELLSTLPGNFLQVHRSYVVNLDHASRIIRKGRSMKLRLGEHVVPVSTSHRAELFRRLPHL